MTSTSTTNNIEIPPGHRASAQKSPLPSCDFPANFESSTSNSPAESESKKASLKSKSKLKPDFSNPNTFVTLIARNSSDSVEFMVHKECVCHHCSVLEAAISSSFLEDQTQTYRFPEVAGPVIKKLFQWFYSQDINVKSIEEGGYHNLETRILMELWVLADKLILRPLQNLVLRKLKMILEHFGILPTLSYRFAKKNTVKGSPLRLFLVHRTAGMTKSSVDAHPQRFPREMLVEMVVAMGNEQTFGVNNFGRMSNWLQYEVTDDS